MYPGDQIWLRNYRRGEKWIKGKYTRNTLINQFEQNLSLHSIPQSIEPDQSNQTIISPPSNNTLSDNPTSTSSYQSPNTPVPIEPNIDTSTQQSNASPCIARDRPKLNCTSPTYWKDYIT